MTVRAGLPVVVDTPDTRLAAKRFGPEVNPPD